MVLRKIDGEGRFCAMTFSVYRFSRRHFSYWFYALIVYKRTLMQKIRCSKNFVFNWCFATTCRGVRFVRFVSTTHFFLFTTSFFLFAHTLPERRGHVVEDVLLDHLVPVHRDVLLGMVRTGWSTWERLRDRLLNVRRVVFQRWTLPSD